MTTMLCRRRIRLNRPAPVGSSGGFGAFVGAVVGGGSGVTLTWHSISVWPG
jgi:hypothetical protein